MRTDVWSDQHDQPPFGHHLTVSQGATCQIFSSQHVSGEQLQDAVPAVAAVAVGSRWDIWETSKLLILGD